MAGCGQIKIHADHSRELASLAVYPMYQHMGIGSTIIRHFLAGQTPPLYLTCRSRLQPYYEKYGFHVCAEDRIPPYFRRLWRFSRFARHFFPRMGELTIMVWE
jgi:N-acetylglutamate synthase-like GNAT family acetyltransferase